MRIELKIFEDKQEPVKRQFKGIWALEEMIRIVLDKYYGTKIANAVLNLLRERRTN